MRRILKRILIGLLCVLVVLLIGASIAKARWDSHFLDGYDASAPLNERVESEDLYEGFDLVKFSFDGVPGLRVPTYLAKPVQPPGLLPCIIFLHGIGQDKDFLKEIAKRFTDAGFAFCSFDQYTRGERKLPKSGQLDGMLALRRRAALNIIETRRLVDYLSSRPDIASDRIYLVGASFGAITGSNAAAFEPRIRATVLTYGGGHLPTLLNSEVGRKEAGSWITAFAYFGAFLMAPSDPILHVDKISPRPVLMQIGTHDTVVPPESGRLLFEAAAQPKELVEYDSDHIGLDEANTIKVLDDSIAWLKRQDEQITQKPTLSQAG